MDTFLSLMLATIIGLGPSFGLLWLITERYQTKIDEKDTMMTFVIGLFAGIPVVLGHLYFRYSYLNGGLLMVSSFLLAVAEVMLYHIYLNRSKFRGRTDTPFIGLSFALGISAMFILYISGQMFVLFDVIPEMLLGMILYSSAIAMFRSSVALYLSNAEVTGKIPWKHVGICSLLLGFFNIFSFVYLGSGFLWTFPIILILLALYLFWRTYPSLGHVPRFVD